MTIDVLTTVYTGNALGLVLLLTLYFSNKGKMTSDRDQQRITNMIFIAIISCFADPIAYTADGHPGLFITIMIYLSNSWLFVANMTVAKMWVEFLADHINATIPQKHKQVLDALYGAGVLIMVLNCFFPLVFSVENNVYKRSYFFALYMVIGGIFIAYSVYLYNAIKKKGGVLSFFPIQAFLVPVVGGIIVQSLFYGISVIWACIAIAIAGVMAALKNEIIFTDSLTGIYNRVYLDYLHGDMERRKTVYVTGIMLDLNGFKNINDTFGHAAGDEALIAVADIFRKTVGEYGTVMRYAGDEFVVLLNTVDETMVRHICSEIDAALENYNRTGGKPYKLSVSMGYAAMDLKNQNMNDFMNTIDRKMYENKARYYNENAK